MTDGQPPLSTDEEVAALLDELTDVHDMVAAVTLEMNELMEKAMPYEVQKEIDGIEAEFRPKLDAGQTAIKLKTERAKEAVLRLGHTVKGDRMMVTYSKPRTKIDTKAVIGFAEAYPKLKALITEGNPSASIKWIPEVKKKQQAPKLVPGAAASE